MRAVVEAPHVMDAADEAFEKWARADVAWDTIKWVLAHDPTKGTPLVEGGERRAFVFHGSWAHETPTIYVEYEFTLERVVLQEAFFRDASVSAGRA